MAKPNITWSQFAVCNDHPTKAFEDMCRRLFTTEFLKGEILPHSDSNNPGVEVLPIWEPEIEDGQQRKKISFQCKYSETSANAYSEFQRSASTTAETYKGKLDLVYLFCNKTLNTTSKAYQKIVSIHKEAGIETKPISNDELLDIVAKYPIIAEYYFQPRKMALTMPGLRPSLDQLLLETWKEHRSFKLMYTDDIERKLFPGIQDSHQFEALGKRKNDEIESPVWFIIRESWREKGNHPIMIQGKGGIGKTVTLFSLTSMAKDTIPAPAVYVPMFELINKDGKVVTLSEYFLVSDSFGSLTKEQRDGICDLARQPWEDGPSLLVLLDGFNEVPHDRRWDVLRMLREWSKANKGAQLIAVSRPMDNLSMESAFGDSTIAVTLSELSKDSVAQYLEGLQGEGVRLPPSDSPIWKTIVYPLFLSLYIKTERLKDQHPWMDYPLRVLDAAGPGSIIWNYLQREMLRQEDEEWILRYALASEYIVPELAYHMLKKNDYIISQSEAISVIRRIVSEMNLERMPNHLKKLFSYWKELHYATEPPDFLKSIPWPEFLLGETGLLYPYRSRSKKNDHSEEKHYEFLHQNFRDCLAGIYLVNQAEMAEDDEFPKVWRNGQSHLVLDYTAELMDVETADQLWETNRKKQQYDQPGYVKDNTATSALLELQTRRADGKPSPLNFSGMDLRGLSLTRYMAQGGKDLQLFQKARLTKKTKLDHATFQSEGHSKSITCMIVLSKGWVVSGSMDGTLRVWDPTTGQCLQTLEWNNICVNCVSVLLDGHVASGSWDNILRVWDITTGQCLQALEIHMSQIRCLATLPNGRVVIGSGDDTLRVLDSATGQCIQVLKGNEWCLTCLSVFLDGRVVSGSADDTLRVWDAASGECLQILKGHSSMVTCVAVLPDGRVVSGSHDNTLRVWNVATGQCLQTLKGHMGWINCVAVFPDGRVVSGSADRTLRVWDPATGECLQLLKSQTNWINCLAILPDGRVISGSDDATLRVWDVDTGICLQTLKKYSISIANLDMTLNRRAVICLNDNSKRKWNAAEGRLQQNLLEELPDEISCWTEFNYSVTLLSEYNRKTLMVEDRDAKNRESHFVDTFNITEVDVSRMDFSQAILTEGLAKQLWYNGATISQEDYYRWVRPRKHEKEQSENEQSENEQSD